MDKIPITQAEYGRLQVMDEMNWQESLQWFEKTKDGTPEAYRKAGPSPPWIRSHILVDIEHKSYWDKEVEIIEKRYFWNTEMIQHLSKEVRWARDNGFVIPEIDE